MAINVANICCQVCLSMRSACEAFFVLKLRMCFGLLVLVSVMFVAGLAHVPTPVCCSKYTLLPGFVFSSGNGAWARAFFL